MIEIRDQQLRLLFLTHLVRELQRSVQESRPAPPGLTQAQYEELCALSTDDLVRLSEMTEPKVAVHIDAGTFEHGLRQVGYIGRRSKQIEHFIRHGATSAMLSKLFRISSTDVTLKRRLFSGTHEKLRRPAMPPPAVREAIQGRWWEIRKGKEGEPVHPEDYEALHAGWPALTYATLWAVVHEFDR
jgi:hypothetical protein